MPGTHRERLEKQERGEVVYLIAWLGGVPVGHLLLKWTGSPAWASLLPGCPTLSDIAVDPEHQSTGIGSQLLDRAEQLVAERGYRRVGLSVALDNVRAHALYDRRGYQDSGLGRYSSRWPYRDDQGQELWREETCVRLVKWLSEQTA